MMERLVAHCLVDAAAREHAVPLWYSCGVAYLGRAGLQALLLVTVLLGCLAICCGVRTLALALGHAVVELCVLAGQAGDALALRMLMAHGSEPLAAKGYARLSDQEFDVTASLDALPRQCWTGGAAAADAAAFCSDACPGACPESSYSPLTAPAVGSILGAMSFAGMMDRSAASSENRAGVDQHATMLLRRPRPPHSRARRAGLAGRDHDAAWTAKPTDSDSVPPQLLQPDTSSDVLVDRPAGRTSAGVCADQQLVATPIRDPPQQRPRPWVPKPPRPPPRAKPPPPRIVAPARLDFPGEEEEEGLSSARLRDWRTKLRDWRGVGRPLTASSTPRDATPRRCGSSGQHVADGIECGRDTAREQASKDAQWAPRGSIALQSPAEQLPPDHATKSHVAVVDQQPLGDAQSPAAPQCGIETGHGQTGSPHGSLVNVPADSTVPAPAQSVQARHSAGAPSGPPRHEVLAPATSTNGAADASRVDPFHAYSLYRLQHREPSVQATEDKQTVERTSPCEDIAAAEEYIPPDIPPVAQLEGTQREPSRLNQAAEMREAMAVDVPEQQLAPCKPVLAERLGRKPLTRSASMSGLKERPGRARR